MVDGRSRGSGLGRRVIRNVQKAAPVKAAWTLAFSRADGRLCPFMSRRGGFRSMPRNGACLVWIRNSSCLRAGQTLSVPPTTVPASGRKVTLIFGVRNGFVLDAEVTDTGSVVGSCTTSRPRKGPPRTSSDRLNHEWSALNHLRRTFRAYFEHRLWAPCRC